ncbi:hypothetical protein FHR99_001175 [Litorivivens lipolytica]|uniref:DUF1214 domain-containing protein n=1 Tax=Litorivivens lipolytica TaxID=1524264 RepID=A0A7W4Z4X8_9GAMM|nr:hypothetical protein [Litorivivens lipolytica]MBB3046939.1 hypothetical protein [Litorivivens lipolytica]
MTDDNKEMKQQLRAAFDDMIQFFQEARDAIDTPELYPAPPTERNLAEGYRYMLGFMLSGIERSLADPLYPRFRRAIQPTNRATIDNADAVYLMAEIDGNYSYRVRGKAKDTRHWRGEQPADGVTAPQYIIFELSSGYAGDSGKLSEMKPGSRINTGTLDSSQIAVDANGEFEILIAPTKPVGYEGNFIPSKRVSHNTEYVGRFLTCRELFHDWEYQDVMDLEILRLDCEQDIKPPITANEAAQLMRNVGEIARNQVHFWNAFNAITLETYGKIPGGISDKMGMDRPFMPVNDMNPPNALGIATGGGQSSNIYAGGTYLLDDNEALIIETHTPVEPAFMGFHLANLWGESLDFESYPSNINAHFLDRDKDGGYRWVVCHKDPGIANWVSTTGLPHGYTSMRWTYPSPPPKEQWPTLKVEKVAFDEIRSKLPEARIVSEAERAEQRLIRHRHVQRRYRQY